MKQGMTLPDLMSTITQQKDVKKDYDVATEVMTVGTNGHTNVAVPLDGQTGHFAIGDFAHGQLAQKFGIGRKFYEHLRADEPDLFDHLLNELFRRESSRVFVRTLNGEEPVVRAVLSPGYLPLDYFDMLHALVPALEKSGLTAENIESCNVSDTNLYLKVVSSRLIDETAVGEPIALGLVAKNSEVGAGALGLDHFIKTLACKNGMTLTGSGKEFGLRRVHVGRNDGDYEGPREWIKDETREAQDRATWLTFRDTAEGMLTDEKFQQVLNKIRGSAEVVVRKPSAAVEAIANRFAFTETETEAVMDFFAGGSNKSGWGLVSAVTRAAEDLDDYDRASELEAIGGKLVTLSPSEWRTIAEGR